MPIPESERSRRRRLCPTRCRCGPPASVYMYSRGDAATARQAVTMISRGVHFVSCPGRGRTTPIRSQNVVRWIVEFISFPLRGVRPERVSPDASPSESRRSARLAWTASFLQWRELRCSWCGRPQRDEWMERFRPSRRWDKNLRSGPELCQELVTSRSRWCRRVLTVRGVAPQRGESWPAMLWKHSEWIFPAGV